MKNKASNILIGYAKVAGLDREAFRRCSGLTPATFSRRMKNPDDITIGELRDMLRAIADACDIQQEDEEPGRHHHRRAAGHAESDQDRS